MVAHLGGHASRAELVALGASPQWIDLNVWYRHILPTRKGWYASKGTHPAILAALRVGGRLACESAVAWHEGREVPEPLHVLVGYGASRLGRGAVVHWTRRELRGSRLVVDEELARRQAATCRARRRG